MRYLNVILILVLCTLGACQTVVSIDLPERDSRLVLNGVAHPDSVWRFGLSESLGILEPGDLKQVNNGSITISGSDGSEELIDGPRFDPRGIPVYRGSSKPTEGVVYQVLVNAEGYDPILAIDSIPFSVPIESVDTQFIEIEGREQVELNITFNDPPSKQYYDMRLFFYVEIPFDTATQQFTPTIYQEEIPYSFEIESFFDRSRNTTQFNDEPFNGQQYTVSVSFEKAILDRLLEDEVFELFPPKLLTELRVVSETNYKYTESFSDYQSSSFDPFAQPVQIYSNVEQGFGVFGTYSAQRDTLELQLD